MAMPKGLDLKSALEQIEGQIARESATYAGNLVEKMEAEIGFVEVDFSDEAKANFDKAIRFLNGKSMDAFSKAFYKLSLVEQDDYTSISDYKAKEIAISNASIKMRNALKKLEVELEVKKLITASISAEEK